MENPDQPPQPNGNVPNLANSPVSPANKKFIFPESAKLGLLLFLLAGGLTTVLLPHAVTKSTTAPPFNLFLVTGLIMVIVTALLFTYLNRLNLGFGKTALVLAVGYNSVIAIIKFLLAPQALYTTNQQTDFTEGIGASPNSPSYYLITGIIILLLYMLVFRMVYKHFRKRLRQQTGETQAQNQKSITRRVVLLTLKIAGIIIGGGAVLIFGVLGGGGAEYLQYIFTGSAIGFPILLAVALAIYLAYRGFEEVNKQVTVTGNATLLAGFFWLGLSMIVLYHIMWIIFMITLVNLWPFRTYTPK